MEIGRRITRQRLETGDRDADVEQRREFQNLIYVSNLVFGQASGFLLPWKRVLKVTDAQVEVVVRDNAQRLYAFKLKSISKDLTQVSLSASEKHNFCTDFRTSLLQTYLGIPEACGAKYINNSQSI